MYSLLESVYNHTDTVLRPQASVREEIIKLFPKGWAYFSLYHPLSCLSPYISLTIEAIRFLVFYYIFLLKSESECFVRKNGAVLPPPSKYILVVIVECQDLTLRLIKQKYGAYLTLPELIYHPWLSKSLNKPLHIYIQSCNEHVGCCVLFSIISLLAHTVRSPFLTTFYWSREGLFCGLCMCIGIK